MKQNYSALASLVTVADSHKFIADGGNRPAKFRLVPIAIIAIEIVQEEK
jgi:hypothetical protein